MVIKNNSKADTQIHYKELTLFDLLKDLYKCKWIIIGATILASTAIWIFLNISYPVTYATECFISIDSAKINLFKNFFNTDFNKEEIISTEVLSNALNRIKRNNSTIGNLRPFLKVEYVSPTEENIDNISDDNTYDNQEKRIKISFITRDKDKFIEAIRKNILSAIIESYKSYLKKRYTIVFEENSFSSTDEYYIVTEKLERELNNITEYIDSDISFIEKNYYLPEIILNLKRIENNIKIINENDIINIKSEIINKCLIKDKKVLVENINYNISKLNLEYQYKIKKVKTAFDLISLIEDKKISNSNMSKLIQYAWDSNSQALKILTMKEKLETELKLINQNITATEIEMNNLEKKLSNLIIKVNNLVNAIKDWRYKYASSILDGQLNITNEPVTKNFRRINIYKYLLPAMFFLFAATSFVCIIVLYIRRNISSELN